ncbi:hypothetical protein FJT64_001392 [Amphibalanus amphitrite]|uniref:Peptidase A2 domain-containing protein n=1 Tax=Amphibalanus amphitrite TaxID=1232801 RepID=A0A6A4V5A7_AMPAM|nr:hypothetical protein FJT64_001392 [Amphibalanus amphitrite]
MDVDTGAARSIMSYLSFKKMKMSKKMEPTSVILRSYGGQRLKVKGKVNVTVEINGQRKDLDLLLVEGDVADAKKTPVDPVMIGILASMVLMFVIICVVLRLFSKAQFRQNRTILNSANPRLMNASFLKGSLIKSPVEQLRGSHSSRGSRAPSLSSLQRPDNEKRGADNSGSTDVNLVQVELNQP